MTMATLDQGTGIFHAIVRTADGRVVECAGDESDVNDWLDELRSVETVLDLDVHELTEAEMVAYGPVYDGPCSDGEPGA